MRIMLLSLMLIGHVLAAEPLAVSPASDLVDPHDMVADSETPLFHITATIEGDRLVGSNALL